MMIFSTINSALFDALSLLIKHDHYLIAADVSERSITHRLALYFESFPCFAGYSIDCEYNRNAEDGERATKKIDILVSEENIYIERFRKKELELGEICGFSTYPDIIIHHRGTNKKNLLVVEAKKSTSKIDAGFDDQKLKAFTGTLQEDKYRYEWGVFILFDVEAPREMPHVRWYKAGEIYDAQP